MRCTGLLNEITSFQSRQSLRFGTLRCSLFAIPMSTKPKLSDNITKQLDEQGISYEFLTEKELLEVDVKWRKKFIGKRTAPHLEIFRWHIFSFQATKSIKGTDANKEYKKQHPTDIYIFNEQLRYGLKCMKQSKLPNIEMEDFFDDIYICHHNMKWTYVITHESPALGPYFS